MQKRVRRETILYPCTLCLEADGSTSSSNQAQEKAKEGPSCPGLSTDTAQEHSQCSITIAAAGFPCHVPFHLPALKFQEKNLTQASSHPIHFHRFPASGMRLPDLSPLVSAQAPFRFSIKPFPFWHEKCLHQAHLCCFTQCAKTLGKTCSFFLGILKMGEQCEFIGATFLREKRRISVFKLLRCGWLNLSLNMQYLFKSCE